MAIVLKWIFKDILWKRKINNDYNVGHILNNLKKVFKYTLIND